MSLYCVLLYILYILCFYGYTYICYTYTGDTLSSYLLRTTLYIQVSTCIVNTRSVSFQLLWRRFKPQPHPIAISIFCIHDSWLLETFRQKKLPPFEYLLISDSESFVTMLIIYPIREMTDIILLFSSSQSQLFFLIQDFCLIEMTDIKIYFNI
jgi:hypothetical protein